jgi:hypothetical protein
VANETSSSQLGSRSWPKVWLVVRRSGDPR